MAIAGAVVVPVSRDSEQRVAEQLRELPAVEIQEIGPKGIAVVLEEKDVDSLRELSEQIKAWQEVMDFQLAYVNWEGFDETAQNT